MKEIKIYKSLWKGIQLVLLSTPFMLLGIWMFVDEGVSFMMIVMIVFASLGYVVSFHSILDRKPEIIINEVGIFAKSLTKDFINWEIIHNSYPMSINGQKFIALVVDEKYEPSKKRGILFKKAMKINKILGAQELNIHLGQVKIDEVKLCLFINLMSKTDGVKRDELLLGQGGDFR